MDKASITGLLSERLRLIRAEYGFTQERMAEILGISKKTLVQIEKGRTRLGWTAAAALCAIFAESEVLQMTLGESPVEVIETAALDNLETPKSRTLGGKVWWLKLKEEGRFRLQQNVISGHFRILDGDNNRWYSSFSRDYIEEKFELLVKRYS